MVSLYLFVDEGPAVEALKGYVRWFNCNNYLLVGRGRSITSSLLGKAMKVMTLFRAFTQLSPTSQGTALQPNRRSSHDMIFGFFFLFFSFYTLSHGNAERSANTESDLYGMHVHIHMHLKI